LVQHHRWCLPWLSAHTLKGPGSGRASMRCCAPTQPAVVSVVGLRHPPAQLGG